MFNKEIFITVFLTFKVVQNRFHVFYSSFLRGIGAIGSCWLSPDWWAHAVVKNPLLFEKKMGLLSSPCISYCLSQLLSGQGGKKLPLVRTEREQNSVTPKMHLFPIACQPVKSLKEVMNG